MKKIDKIVRIILILELILFRFVAWGQESCMEGAIGISQNCGAGTVYMTSIAMPKLSCRQPGWSQEFMFVFMRPGDTVRLQTFTEMEQQIPAGTNHVEACSRLWRNNTPGQWMKGVIMPIQSCPESRIDTIYQVVPGPTDTVHSTVIDYGPVDSLQRILDSILINVPNRDTIEKLVYVQVDTCGQFTFTSDGTPCEITVKVTGKKIRIDGRLNDLFPQFNIRSVSIAVYDMAGVNIPVSMEIWQEGFRANTEMLPKGAYSIRIIIYASESKIFRIAKTTIVP